MEDVSPKLLKQVQDSFQASFDNDKRLKKIYEKIEAGTATYSEANDFAVYAGEHLAKAYKQITSADLPDGRMYYNIANSIIPPTMTNNYDLVSQVATQIQQNLNEEAGIGLKAITPELNEDRIDGIVNRISSEANFDDISWILDSPIVDFSQSIVDDSIRENAEFHGEAGMTPKIIRKNAYFGCCDWCSKLEGTYIYPDVPQDVYRRHDNCRCKVDYHPGNGKKQNVHSREWRKESLEETLNSKNRGKKVMITDQAIEKVGTISPSGFSEDMIEYTRTTNKELLSFARSENFSNEVACVVDLENLTRLSFVPGSEHYVDILGDTDSYHWIASKTQRSLMICHNHPGLTDFSMNDISVFMQPTVKTMTIVTNQGKMSYISKNDQYDYKKAVLNMRTLREKYGADFDKVVDKFLKDGYNYGIERG